MILHRFGNSVLNHLTGLGRIHRAGGPAIHDDHSPALARLLPGGILLGRGLQAFFPGSHNRLALLIVELAREIDEPELDFQNRPQSIEHFAHAAHCWHRRPLAR